MRDLIAYVIETLFGLYDEVYSDVLYYGSEAAAASGLPEAFSGYMISGWLIILIPIFVMLLFYKAFDLVNGKVWHWLIAFVIALFFVFLANWGIATKELETFISDPDNNTNIDSFIIEYGFFTMIISIIPSLIGITWKFISTNNRYNPF